MSEENIFAAMLREHAHKMDIECAPEESDFWAAADHIYLLERQLYTSQARLSEAVKVLEPFLNVRDQHPESVKLINGNMDSFTVMAVHVTKGQFLAAKAFLATLGEET